MISSNPARRSFNTALLTACFAAAFGLVSQQASAITLADIQKKGEVTVGALVDFAPFGVLSAKNEPDGYDIDVANLLAKRWGVNLKLVPVTGPNRVAYLQTNKVDLIIGGLGITSERAKQVAFSKPYAEVQVVVFAKKSTRIESADDLKGLRVGVTRGASQDVALTKTAPAGTQLRRFDDDASTNQAFISDQIDAIGSASTIIQQISKRLPADKYETKFTLVTHPIGIAMRYEQDDLMKNTNDFIEEVKGNGDLNKLYLKWFETTLPEFK